MFGCTRVHTQTCMDRPIDIAYYYTGRRTSYMRMHRLTQNTFSLSFKQHYNAIAFYECINYACMSVSLCLCMHECIHRCICMYVYVYACLDCLHICSVCMFIWLCNVFMDGGISMYVCVCGVCVVLYIALGVRYSNYWKCFQRRRQLPAIFLHLVWRERRTERQKPNRLTSRRRSIRGSRRKLSLIS